jgi:uncharacterized membrane protein
MADGIHISSVGPLSVLAIILLVALVVLLLPLFILGVIGVAFTRLGLSWITALALVLLILAGSVVNIPVYRIRRDMIRAVPVDIGATERGASFYVPPVWETVISVNLGGGIIPVGIAIYLMYQAVILTGTAFGVPVVLSAFVVMIITFFSTREVAGVGIRVPFLLPSLTALLVGVLFAGGTGLTAAVTALAGGTLGTLAGGNLIRLGHVRDLDVPEVSIGGFGTFGAVFLCCVLPALIA